MTASDAQQLFDSKSYARWQEAKKIERQNVVAVATAVGVVVEAINNLSKGIKAALGRMR